jgi:hypothetical protein
MKFAGSLKERKSTRVRLLPLYIFYLTSPRGFQFGDSLRWQNTCSSIAMLGNNLRVNIWDVCMLAGGIKKVEDPAPGGAARSLRHWWGVHQRILAVMPARLPAFLWFVCLALAPSFPPRGAPYSTLDVSKWNKFPFSQPLAHTHATYTATRRANLGLLF